MGEYSKKTKRQAVWLTFADVLNKEQLIQLIKTLEIDFPKNDMNSLISYVKEVSEQFKIDQASTKLLYTALYSHLNSADTEHAEDPLIYIQPQLANIHHTGNKPLQSSVATNINLATEKNINNESIIKPSAKEPSTIDPPGSSHTDNAESVQDQATINSDNDASDQTDNENSSSENLPGNIPLPPQEQKDSTANDMEKISPEILVFEFFMDQMLTRFPLDQTELLDEIALHTEADKSFSKLDTKQVIKWSKAPESFQWALISSEETMSALIHLSYTILCDFLGPVETDNLFQQILTDCKQIAAAKKFNPENFF